MKIIDSQEEIQMMYDMLDKQNYPFNEYNPFAFRNFADIQKGLFNDTLCILNEEALYICPATTDPSPYYIKHYPMNKNGTAVMVDNILQEKIWMVGGHGKTRYTALINGWRFGFGTKRQRVKRLDKNFKFKNKIYRGWFGCNMHKVLGGKVLERIGANSAGCQVYQNEDDFNSIMSFILNSQEYQFNKRTLYSYYIFTNQELAKELAA